MSRFGASMHSSAASPSSNTGKRRSRDTSAVPPTVFCRETVEPGSAFHARMFAPRLGIVEDPATGAAAAAFAGVLAHFAPPSEGDHEFSIEQGHEMGRPSLIGLSLTMKNRQLAAAAISGEATLVSEGTIEA